MSKSHQSAFLLSLTPPISASAPIPCLHQDLIAPVNSPLSCRRRIWIPQFLWRHNELRAERVRVFFNKPLSANVGWGGLVQGSGPNSPLVLMQLACRGRRSMSRWKENHLMLWQLGKSGREAPEHQATGVCSFIYCMHRDAAWEG